MGMINSSYEFHIYGKDKKTEAKGLAVHISARQAIVKQTSVYNCSFGSDNEPKPKKGETWRQFYDRVIDHNRNSKNKFSQGCKRATMLIVNAFTRGTKERDYDGVWIPGDAGYIDNLAETKNPEDWKKGYEGENIIYLGSGKFWGHLDARKNRTLQEWKRAVDRWRNGEGIPVMPGEAKKEMYPYDRSDSRSRNIYKVNSVMFPADGLEQ